MAFKVSHSKIKTWRFCRNAYHYKYVEKLRAIKKGRPLIFGSIIHDMCEAWIINDDPWVILEQYENKYKNLFLEEQEMYGDIIGDARRVMEIYFDYYEDDPLEYYEFEGRKAEYPFELPLVEDITINGFIDTAAHSQDGRFWIVERKSGKQFAGEEERFRDIQVATYIPMMQELGFPTVDGVCWDHVRSKAPTIPEMLKSGAMSKKNIDTTWPIYRAALKANKLKVKAYLDMKEKLEGKETQFVRRLYLPIRRPLIKQLMTETKQTAIEMRDTHGKDRTRNMTRNCSFCDYFRLCQGELLGKDTDFIKEHHYTMEAKDGSKKGKKKNVKSKDKTSKGTRRRRRRK